MKIIFIAHMWCPIHNAGGETTVHSAMREMVARGHEVDVICRPQSQSEANRFTDYTHEGVRVHKCPLVHEQQWIKAKTLELNPDLLITHLDLTTQAMQLAIDIQLPLAHWAHNTMSFDTWKVNTLKCQLAIFNSKWVADYHKWEGDYIVLHPTVEPEQYRSEKGTKITLVNPTPGKGADTFYQLAKLMPNHEFLTVKGVYGEQVAPPNINPAIWPNVEFMEHTPDIRDVFRKTKVILMPSLYESYGRVGVEAACVGIPTIAHPTPGLKESLGEAGIFYDRDDIPAWHEQLKRLFSDEVYYRKRSDLALQLASKLAPESEFDRLEEALLVTTQKWQDREKNKMEKVVTCNRRLGKTADGRLTDNMAEAQSLVCGTAGDPIPDQFVEQAKQMGFAEVPAEQTETLLDTAALTQKAVEAPQENKAIEAPPATKQRKTRARKTA